MCYKFIISFFLFATLRCFFLVYTPKKKNIFFNHLFILYTSHFKLCHINPPKTLKNCNGNTTLAISNNKSNQKRKKDKGKDSSSLKSLILNVFISITNHWP